MELKISILFKNIYQTLKITFDELGTTNSSKLQFPVVMSGTSYGYKNTSGTFVAFRGDSTATYTYAANSTGGTVDMGARNNYRYVNAANVYAKGKADGTTTHTSTYTPTTRSSALDMGVNHSYRYVNTNSVPNTNSDTYTYAANSTGGKVDMGAANTYRYVNASNVYAKGKADGANVFPSTLTFKLYSGDSVNMTAAVLAIPKFIYSQYNYFTVSGSNVYSTASVIYSTDMSVSFPHNVNYGTKTSISNKTSNYISISGQGSSNSGYYMTVVLSKS